jgi:glycerol-1-phosphatase
MTARVLGESAQPLVSRYDVALLDLDGVLYRGEEAIPDAPAAVEKAVAGGMRLAFVTNNASRSPQMVAEHLRRLGVSAAPGDVITSAQAAARVLAGRLPPGARVLVVGTESLAREVTSVGLGLAATAQDAPAAVVQGYSPDTGWRLLAEAVVAVRSGALWVATNTDLTLPSERGPLPGNGAFVAVVQLATQAAPLVAGKPEPAMHHEMMQRTGAQRPLIVGDRLDTDIEGATRAGVESLLVLTGVTTPAQLLHAPPPHRPTYLAAGLAGLLATHPAPRPDGDGGWRCGRFAASADHGVLRLTGDGEDDADALRALCACAWAASEREAGDGPGARRVTGSTVQADAAVHRLGLDA